MTLEQLRIFVAVAEHEHMTRAAESLHLTQSATSAAIAALETRYATKLFHRVGRRIELTEIGRAFLVEARAVLARAAAATTVLTDLAGMSRGSLAIAASQTVGNYFLPPLLAHYRQRFPGIALDLRIGNTEQVASWVRDGEVDLGVVEGDVDDGALAVETVGDDELVLVVGRAHRWAEAARVTGADFADSAWVLREAGSGTRAIAQAILTANMPADRLRIAMELPSNEAVCAAVAAGAGATIMSRLVAAARIASGDLVAVDAALPTRRFVQLRHKERYLTQAAREMSEMMTAREGS
ncbi:LysR family transcriptional regulator [Tardiphaga alba]|uniref:LysR family transcriptional regulator n=1 Tax=Tardiphaga alba TaxID=340268 RepID=A0ABX8A6V7_9BRAD|nr:LysR family transcriptional regulator [Tardiphaga alba]QUS38223.1 LysR family transcriptional regulator [Tardiphaga alba]